MKLHLKLVVGLVVLALGLVPAMGMADGPNYTPEGPNYQPEHPPTPPKGHAYGYWCNKQGFSKKHVKGQKGTPFSQCVHALKVADHNDGISAKKACKALKTPGNRHKPHGDKGTAFSRCIKAVNQLRKEDAATVTASAAVS